MSAVVVVVVVVGHGGGGEEDGVSRGVATQRGGLEDCECEKGCRRRFDGGKGGSRGGGGWLKVPGDRNDSI